MPGQNPWPRIPMTTRASRQLFLAREADLLEQDLPRIPVVHRTHFGICFEGHCEAISNALTLAITFPRLSNQYYRFR
jgi:hypothetical protein